MVRVGSFVFLDLETTGLPWQERFQTKITEMAMVSVNRDHMLSSELGYLPRVLQKLVLCFHTSRVISETVERVTGLSNRILQNERRFDKDTVDTIKGFLDRQQKPVCFVVHNGNTFDYPILRAEIDDLQMSLPDDIVCVDSLVMFRQFYKKKSVKKETFGRMYINQRDWEVLNKLEMSAMNNENSNSQQSQPSPEKDSNSMADDDFVFDLIDEVLFLTSSAETSSVDNQNNVNIANKIDQELTVVGKFTKNENSIATSSVENIFLNGSKKTGVKKIRESFKLGELYIRLLGKEPTMAHHAEGDCLMLLECCMVEPNRFVQYCDGNSKSFASIPRMQSKFHPSVSGKSRPMAGVSKRTHKEI